MTLFYNYTYGEGAANIPFIQDWSDSDLSDGILSADQTELFSGLDEPSIRTLYQDIQQIESSGSSQSSSTESETSECHDTQKIEIRNLNCMWSGLCSSSSSTTTNVKQEPFDETKAYDTVDITNIKLVTNSGIEHESASSVQQQQQQPQIQQQIITKVPTITPTTTTSTVTTITTQQQQQQQQQQNMQNVPPGTSLLKSNQQKKQQRIVTPTVMPSEFIRDRVLNTSCTSSLRPDTPLSLDDDTHPEFKHSVDLAACIMGSNNISLEADNDKIMINKLREQLEDTSTRTIVLPGHKQRTLTEVLNVIESETKIGCSNLFSGVSDGMDTEESETEYEDYDEEIILSNTSSSLSSSSSQSSLQTNSYPVMMHSDHSYTRSKDGVDIMEIGLETPSDSDEEIDVVSIGDKKLPTNPSDKDRRALQQKLSARMVKTANGLRTIPPRRRISYDPPYTPMSISPIKSASSLASSRYPSPAETPVYSSQVSTVSINTKYHPTNSSAQRKRNSNNSANNSANRDDYMPPNKRHRGKKQKQSSPAKQRHYSADEADTIEKRNLHNDMERQRRIGLKNLFEALKKQIPSIKDKERAPKVNILREAAKLCEQLTHDGQVFSNKHQLLAEQVAKRKELLNRLMHSKR